jgi:anti-sigma B factor antagonist
MNVTEETRGALLVLRVHEPRLDAANAPALREVLIRQVDAGHDRLVLDLSESDFMDSSGLGALVSCLKRLGSRGALAVVGTKGEVARLFRLTRMDRVFALHPDLETAVKQLEG